MKQSPGEFESRTGLTYDPPQWLRSLARPFERGEPCPTLFRYPGPEGILASLQGRLSRLAPGPLPYAWLSTTPGTGVPAAATFGAVAVLDPLRLSPCVAPERDACLAVNGPLDPDCEVVWIPPDPCATALPWDTLQSGSQVVSALGVGYAALRSAMIDRVAAYLEEVDLLRKAGADTRVAWCERSLAYRRRVLSEYGIAGQFTR